ncbi:MAG: hypothetical protein IPO70_10070 [Bacteroidetes bacterium]|nr:hypothetical protein [Bacteroidota bacterium]
MCNSQGLTNRWYLGYGGLNTVYYGSGTNVEFLNDSLAITRMVRKWGGPARNLFLQWNGRDTCEGRRVASSPRGSSIIHFGRATNIIFSVGSGSNNYTYFPFKAYFSVIDMSLNNGLGAVTSKNNIAFNDTMAEFGLIAACKHATGAIGGW